VHYLRMGTISGAWRASQKRNAQKKKKVVSVKENQKMDARNARCEDLWLKRKNGENASFEKRRQATRVGPGLRTERFKKERITIRLVNADLRGVILLREGCISSGKGG